MRRLSDVIDDEIGRLAEDCGDRATALELAESDHSLLRACMPPEARWAAVSGRESYAWSLDDRACPTAPADIGQPLTKALRAVPQQNPALVDVIDVVDFAAERSVERDINPAKLRGAVESEPSPTSATDWAWPTCSLAKPEAGRSAVLNRAPSDNQGRQLQH